MRLILSVASLAVIGLSSSAVAADNAVPVVPATASSATVPVVQVARSRTVSRPARSSQQGFFSQLMEVERQKNAWLRRTFLR